MRARRGQVEIDGVVGSRLWSAGGGRGVYGEATVAVPLSGLASLVLSGGRYPTDPWRGTISGRYVSAGIRVRSRVPGRQGPTSGHPSVFAASGPSPADGFGAAASLEVHTEGAGVVRLVIHAAGVSSVEVSGDFTDWLPLSLSPAGPGTWRAVLRIEPGAHRMNVRLDGGAWFVPAGVTRVADDYGGETGIVVIP